MNSCQQLSVAARHLSSWICALYICIIDCVKKNLNLTPRGWFNLSPFNKFHNFYPHTHLLTRLAWRLLTKQDCTLSSSKTRSTSLHTHNNGYSQQYIVTFWSARKQCIQFRKGEIYFLCFYLQWRFFTMLHTVFDLWFHVFTYLTEINLYYSKREAYFQEIYSKMLF